MQVQTENTPSPGEGLTFEKVWASIQELKELQKENAIKMEETDRRIGELGNRFGELAEHLVAPSIMKKFNALGFEFTERSLDKEIIEPGNPNACVVKYR